MKTASQGVGKAVSQVVGKAVLKLMGEAPSKMVGKNRIAGGREAAREGNTNLHLITRSQMIGKLPMVRFPIID